MKQLAFAAISSAFACVAFCNPPAGFENRVETVRRQVGVPGMAIAIVENDRVTFAKGFGIGARQA
jgi:CubicO group peptidase (beta-lactamase class C family)